MKKAVSLILAIFLLCSCADKEQIIGKWDDNIKLSTKHAEFSAGADSVTISTEGSWWWIDAITFEDSTYMYYGREDINLESEAYAIHEEHFTVERKDKNTLFIKLNANPSAHKRNLSIVLEAGDYFDYVSIQQATK